MRQLPARPPPQAGFGDPSLPTRSLVRDIPFLDPLTAFADLRNGGFCALLDSAAEGPDTGRYAFIGVDPVATLAASWDTGFDRLAGWMSRLPALAPLPDWPFSGGIVASFGYELRRALERLSSRHPAGPGPADLTAGLFDTIVAFDLIEHRAAILACDLDPDRAPAPDRAARLAERLQACPALPDPGWAETAEWEADFTPDAYRARVARVRAYIAAGDIYQANFTQRWSARRPPGLDPFTLYRRLRALSPAPYAAFLQDGLGSAILAASPERFLRLHPDRRMDTRPIKGTRPRGTTPIEDRRNAVALAASAKDQAENLMIVDLLRNDLGRVAETGSVAVPELNRLYSFASVHHLVSTVTGRLRRGIGPVELIRAVFPGGSVTGAPKIRAMEIIDELEAGRRGPYCGAIGWIGLDGAMELSIAIRTLTVTPDRVVAQAGGGIVADSDPDSEYREALTKARPMLATLDPRFRSCPSFRP